MRSKVMNSEPARHQDTAVVFRAMRQVQTQSRRELGLRRVTCLMTWERAKDLVGMQGSE